MEIEEKRSRRDLAYGHHVSAAGVHCEMVSLCIKLSLQSGASSIDCLRGRYVRPGKVLQRNGESILLAGRLSTDTRSFHHLVKSVVFWANLQCLQVATTADEMKRPQSATLSNGLFRAISESKIFYRMRVSGSQLHCHQLKGIGHSN